MGTIVDEGSSIHDKRLGWYSQMIFSRALESTREVAEKEGKFHGIARARGAIIVNRLVAIV